ncbi:MAG: ethanolamine utilization protein EutJ [Chloroflexi bacterium]|nr:ethanolamine utilization protein EutJ [Chloroflexota bacterium]
MSAETGFVAFNPETFLEKAAEVILPPGHHQVFSPSGGWNGNLRVGVDLGTAYLVLSVLSPDGMPLAGQYRFAQVVRDGLVVDYIGAVDLLREMKRDVENNLNIELTHAASGFPPGVPQVEVRATANVVEAAGMTCTGLIDEPSAANNILGLRDGAIIDVGGGTTGIALLKDGKVIYTADEATGGTHFSLVIAGALDIPFEEAEKLKTDPAQQPRLFPLVRPVMEKVGSIISHHLNGKAVDHIILVGGASAFPGMASVIQEYTGLPTRLSAHPMLVTPLGIAMHDQKLQE